jgi:hypothetical protein
MDDKLENMLKNNIMLVTFTKNNGEDRLMRCTLQESYIIKKAATDDNIVVVTATARKQSNSVIAVWDIDKNAWRSFRKDSVRLYEVME